MYILYMRLLVVLVVTQPLYHTKRTSQASQVTGVVASLLRIAQGVQKCHHDAANANETAWHLSFQILMMSPAVCDRSLVPSVL